ncbi:transcriptional regulator with XRE-family HTH domain [Rhizobium leguminosarum]
MDVERTGPKKRRKITAQGAHPIDLHVGRRIFLARRAKRMSQLVLADRLGITFQQIQKYEKGKNRVNASVLYGIMRALDVSAAYFFDGFATEETPAPERDIARPEDTKAVQPIIARPQHVNLLQNYLGAPIAVRKAVRSLLSCIAKEET